MSDGFCFWSLSHLLGPLSFFHTFADLNEGVTVEGLGELASADCGKDLTLLHLFRECVYDFSW